MPRVFKAFDISAEEKKIKRDYFDRHTPVVICEDKAVKGEKFRVKVKVGNQYLHPDDPDHYISYLQLWNRETFLGQVNFTPGVLGNFAGQAEVDFYIVPQLSLNLSAMANCTKHGLWQSEPKKVIVK